MIFIILIALLLRIFNISYMEFKGDEAYNSFKSLKLARENDIPLTAAVGSTGINEPPAFIYIISIPYFFSPDPRAAAIFIALLNVGGIMLCYMFLKRFYSGHAPIIAAALYAVNPWHVLSSRKIWTQYLLPFFVILFIYFIFQAIYERKKGSIVYAMIALGILTQLHLSAAYFIIIAIAVFIRYWKSLDKRYLAIGVAIFLLTYLPYFIFQAKNELVDVRTAIDILKKPTLFNKEAFTIPLRLVTTNGFNFLLGQDFEAFEKGAPNIRVIDILSASILLFSIIFLFIALKKGYFVFAVWISIGTFYMAFNKISIDIHYFTSFFPLYFIIIGVAMGWLFQKGNKYLKRICCLAVIAIVAYQFLFSLHFLAFIKQKDCILGEYGPPYYHQLKKIEAIIKADLPFTAININKIHTACNCPVKCDILATKFIAQYLL